MANYDKFTRRLDRIEREMRSRAEADQIGHSSIEGRPLKVKDADGTERLRIGAQDDGTHAVKYVQGPPPPRPTAPVVSVDGPVVRVRWDGMLLGGHIPEDFARIDVHFALASDDLEDASAVRGNLATSAGNETVLAATQTGTYRVGLVAMSQSRARSEMSEVVEVEVTLVDIEGALDAAVENARGGSNHYSPEPPSGTDHDPDRDLWFDTSADAEGLVSYSPHRWDGQEWVSLEDERTQAIQDAQGQLEADIDSVRTSVDGKSRITQSVGAPPSQYDGAVGDRWERMSSMGSGGSLISNWRWNGSVWVSTIISDAVLGNVDAGKITAGVMSGERIEAGTLTSDKLLIGDFSNLVDDPALSGPGWSGDLPFEFRYTSQGPGNAIYYAGEASGWVDNSNRFPVMPGDKIRITGRLQNRREGDMRLVLSWYTHDGSSSSETLFSGVLYPSTGTSFIWADVEDTVTAPSDARFAVLRVGFSSGGNGQAYMIRPVVRRMTGSTLIEDGAITTEKIAVGAITAESGIVGSLDAGVITVGQMNGARIESKTIKTEQLAADAIDGILITGAVQQSSHEHPKSIQNSTGFHITDEDGQDQVSLTTEGGDFLALRTPDGSTLANISDEGIFSGRGLNIEEDPVFMGKELLGTQAEFSHPSEFEADGMLDFMPRGMIARAYRNNAGRSAFTNTETSILEFSYDHEPSRAYKIVIAPFSIYVDGGNAYGYLNVYITTDGSRPRADGNPTFRQLVRNPGNSRALYDFGGEFYHVTDLPPTTVRILYTFTADGGQVSFFGNVSGAAIRTWVEDMGLSVPDTGIDRNERREIASTVPPPTPTEPERRNYTKTYKATSGRTFWTSGGYRTDNTQYAYQGSGPHGGSQRSIILFPSMTGDLSGAEITAMRVYLYFEHWYYSSGGEAKIHAHSRSDLPTSIPAMQGMVTSSNWPKPGGRWVNIPKEYWNNFRTGDYKGIGLGNPTGNRTQYGYARISSTKIEVKYRK